MAKLLRVSDRHQITLPPMILKEAGIAQGAYLSVEAKNGKIVLEPKVVDDGPLTLTDVEWAKLDEAVSREIKAGRYKEFKSAKAANKYLKSL